MDFAQADQLVEWLLGRCTDLFTLIKSNWILMLSFCVSLMSLVVSILHRIKHIRA